MIILGLGGREIKEQPLTTRQESQEEGPGVAKHRLLSANSRNPIAWRKRQKLKKRLVKKDRVSKSQSRTKNYRVQWDSSRSYSVQWDSSQSYRVQWDSSRR